jgi:hypothetical protein
MPSFKKTLTEEDRWCVIEYIRLLGQSAAAEAGK